MWVTTHVWKIAQKERVGMSESESENTREKQGEPIYEENERDKVKEIEKDREKAKPRLYKLF